MKAYIKLILGGLCCSFIGIASLFANPHSTVVLKNGSVINGDIIVQRPGKDVTINSEDASFVITPQDIKSRRQSKVKYEDLPREWKRWAIKNRALQGDAFGRFLIMENIETENNSHKQIIKKSQDSESNHEYLQVSPTVYKINWKDIREIKKNTGAIGNDKYLADEVKTFSGKTYRGTISSQRPGDGLTIKTDKGSVDIKSEQIKETAKSVASGNDTTDLFGNIDYINTLILSDGKVKKGLIVGQLYNKKRKENQVVFLPESGREERIPVSKITEYQTTYASSNTDAYRKGEVYVNEFLIPIAKTKFIGDNRAYIDKAIFPFPEGIETTFKSAGDKFNGNWKMIALEDLTLSNGSSTMGYNNETKKTNSFKPSHYKYENGIGMLSFVYLSPGYYALVNDDESETYVIKITK